MFLIAQQIPCLIISKISSLGMLSFEHISLSYCMESLLEMFSRLRDNAVLFREELKGFVAYF